MQVNDILNKNLEAIQEIDVVFYQKILEYMSNQQADESTVNIEYLENGDAVLSVWQDNRIWYMNSRYSEDVFKEYWCEQFQNTSYLSPYIIFGLGTGGYIRTLNERLTETNIVLIVEPNPEIFICVIKNVDISDIIMEKKLILVVNQLNDGYILEFMNHILNYGRMRTVEYGVLPNYLGLYRKEWNRLRAIVKENCEREVLNRNTNIAYTKEFAANIFANMQDLPKQYIVNQLKAVCDKKDISDVPAIIVSAGPSLDKNIRELKNAEHKAFIIATDSALKPLLRNGIMPDIAMTLDPHKPQQLFFHTEALTIPMIVCCVSNKKLWVIHRGKRFYFSEGNTFINHIYQSYGDITLPPLDTGGSVANNCFSFARYLGFKKIILMGQDLAYPEHRRHAFAVYDKDDQAEKNREYVEVEDIYGNMVITDLNMESYLRWFEGQVILYPDIKVMDATEGGAKIQGTEIITLKEVIERECKQEIHFKEDIEQLQPFFEQRKQEQIFEFYKNIPEKLNELRQKMRDGIKDYDKLLTVYRTKGTGTKEYQKLVKKIGKLSKQIEELPILALVEIFNQAEKYQVLADAYVVKEELDDEIVAIVNSGKKMLQSYEKAIDEFLECYEKHHNIDIKRALKGIRANKARLVQIVEDIEHQEWNAAFEKIGIFIRAVSIILDWLVDMSALHKWELDSLTERFERLFQELLLRYDERNYSELKRTLENDGITLIQEFLHLLENDVASLEQD